MSPVLLGIADVASTVGAVAGSTPFSISLENCSDLPLKNAPINSTANKLTLMQASWA
ncbi:hypothetical protein SAMN05216202_3239 [Pseudomonas mucidolens]|uniref:Uncharacterized protein n=1 Tax=Pseudomonas mucidolens TaxID=46679 RepID=A0A1H2N8V0_9PSED|nr:hypothetical protein [Pseudomonas mucidolens]SDV01907.1 hypothetical protein SAMN05216202_3239 [Pseudomonas mucidolens]SQH32406.1 Uncharacterised protein [Pseudomonas mucidolens]